MVYGERRKKINAAYAALVHGRPQTDEAINFVNRTCGCKTLSQFLDTAKTTNVLRLEGILKI